MANPANLDPPGAARKAQDTIRRYNAFRLRPWRAGDTGRRIAIEHVQSGETVLTASTGAALAWVAARGGAGREPGRAPLVLARISPARGRAA